MKKTVHLIIGTRPEAVKMAPVLLALRRKKGLRVRLVSTGQHRELLRQTLAAFDLEPDHDLDVMKEGQSLSTLTARLLLGIEKLFASERPDLVLGHGDTTTCYAAALSSFYHSIPFFHVEAGLRTFRLDSPFPEEFNRQCVSRMAAHHFAPSDEARRNLLADGILPGAISLVGSTAHDAIRLVRDSVNASRVPGGLAQAIDAYEKIALFTLHRRDEGAGAVRRVMSAIRESAALHPEAVFLLPVHPNPSIRALSSSILGSAPNVLLTAPLDYPIFLSILSRASLVLTDSGGVQEEAAFFGKTALICRDVTERRDGLDERTVRIVGTDPDRIVARISEELKAPPRPSRGPGRSAGSASLLVADTVLERCFA